MVAEVEDAERIRLPVRGPEIPLLMRIKARNLYLMQNLGWDAIGKQCGYSPKALAHLAHREKWTEEKRQRKAALLKSADARMNSMQSEVVEAIASLSEQHAIRALDKTGEALERGDPNAAKDAQAYSSTAKNLVSIARESRNPSSTESGQASGSINLFFLPTNLPAAKTEKQAEVVELSK